MQPTLISRFVALMVVKQELAMAKESFNTVEMAFVYGVVTMALASSASSNRSEKGREAIEGVSVLLSQAGYEVVIVEGCKKEEPHRWLEVGRHGGRPELIVDLSAPENPHDTVLPKCSRTGRTYLAGEDLC